MASYAETCSECVVWNNIDIPVILPETLLVEAFALLGCYTVFIRSCTSYRCPILEGPIVLDFLTLENGTDRLSRNSAINYRSTLHNIPEELKSHLYRGRSLISHIIHVIWVVKHDAKMHIYDDIRKHHRYIHFEVDKTIEMEYIEAGPEILIAYIRNKSSVGQLVQ